MIPADQRPTKVAIFQEKTDWGNELGGLFKADAKPAGYDVVYYGEYAPGTTDYSIVILEAQAAGADMSTRHAQYTGWHGNCETNERIRLGTQVHHACQGS